MMMNVMGANAPTNTSTSSPLLPNLMPGFNTGNNDLAQLPRLS